MEQPRRAAAVSPALARAAAVSWRALVVAAAAALVLVILVELRLVVLPVIAATLLATVLHPLVGALHARGTPRLVATWIVLLAVGALVGLAAWLVVPQVVDEIGSVDLSVTEGLDRVEGWLEPLGVSEGSLDDSADRAREWLVENGGGLSGSILGGVALAIEIVAGGLLALVLLFFFLKDGARIWAWVARLFPARHRHDIDAAASRAWTTLGAYMRGTAIVALVDAVLIAIVIAALGVPLVLPLALLTFAGAFFPLIGAVVAGLVAALVALVTEGPVEALILIGAIIVIQQLEGDLLQPLILGRAVRLHPVAILLSLTAGVAVAGVVGAFLAVPIAAVAASVGGYLRGRAGRPVVITKPPVESPDSSLEDR